MTREIHALRDDAAAWYSSVLDEVTAVLPSSIDRARQILEPIAGEVWMGSLTLHGVIAAGSDVRTARRVSDRTRAEVFLRDGFLCTYCGGRTIPRCILVAISDVFPDELPYYAHYRRGTVHPAYWALAPEADHILAHAGGGQATRRISLPCTRCAIPGSPASQPTLCRWSPRRLHAILNGMDCSRATPTSSPSARRQAVGTPPLATTRAGFVASDGGPTTCASTRAPSGSARRGVR
ncbi:hypothetical protein SRABI76_01369 [Microbacterium oxydans]|nr:hypothetical protein SRABI76_01369 [Microbacterium oxydans]